MTESWRRRGLETLIDAMTEMVLATEDDGSTEAARVEDVRRIVTLQLAAVGYPRPQRPHEESADAAADPGAPPLPPPWMAPKLPRPN